MPVYHDLATGLASRGRTVDVVARVTAAVGVIDRGGPTVVVDDGTAAVAVVVPEGAPSPRVGAVVRFVGKTGSLHGGPRVVASLVELRGDGVNVKPRQVTGAIGAEYEWQLVNVYGRIQRLVRAGLRWRVDLTVGRQTVGILGEPGAEISVAGLTPGRLALVTGIVRRSTSDSSVFELLPRSAADLILGPAPAGSGGSSDGPSDGKPTARPSGSGAAGATPTMTDARLITIADIPSQEGKTVTLAGLIAETGPETAILDDGTGRVRLGGAAASEAISLLELGDAVEVTGRVSRDADGWLIEVDPSLIVALAGTPGTAPSADGALATAEATASEVPGLGGGVPPAAGQANGLARSGAGIGDSGPLGLLALAVAVLAALAMLGLAFAFVARRRGFPTRLKRLTGRLRGSRDAAAPDLG